MKPRYLLAMAVPVLLFVSVSSGEIIRLKNGTILQGRIAFESPEVVRIIDAATNKEVNLRRAEIANMVSEKVFDNVIDFGQLRNLKEEGWKKLEEKSKKAEEAKTAEAARPASFSEKFQPKIGLGAAYMMPTGDIGTVLDPAIGFGLVFDMRMPVFAMTSPWSLRTGLAVSYASFGSKMENFPADVTLLPILLNNEIGYATSSGLRPYFTLDLGITMASLKDKSDNTEKKDTSSMDLTVFAGAGVGYRHKSLPSLELFLDAGYMMVFEQTSGNFINVNFGAAFHFFSRTEDRL
ncbi:MAG: hypothetical protein C4555_04505 [Dehalococcoidia bacterium]|nr:MAG: hypothetical protein C4555_04505 [Dehalococcoidia bacterium]